MLKVYKTSNNRTQSQKSKRNRNQEKKVQIQKKELDFDNQQINGQVVIVNAKFSDLKLRVSQEKQKQKQSQNKDQQQNIFKESLKENQNENKNFVIFNNQNQIQNQNQSQNSLKHTNSLSKMKGKIVGGFEIQAVQNIDSSNKQLQINGNSQQFLVKNTLQVNQEKQSDKNEVKIMNGMENLLNNGQYNSVHSNSSQNQGQNFQNLSQANNKNKLTFSKILLANQGVKGNNNSNMRYFLNNQGQKQVQKYKGKQFQNQQNITVLPSLQQGGQMIIQSQSISQQQSLQGGLLSIRGNKNQEYNVQKVNQLKNQQQKIKQIKMENQQQMFNMTDQNFAKFKQIDKQGELIQNNSNNNVINPSYQMNRGSLLYRSVQGNFENQSQIIQSTSQQNKQIGQYKNQDNFKIVKKVNISQNQQGNGQQGNQPYKFYIGSGNNGDLIRRILLKRQNWVETKDNSTMFVNFKWQQGSRGYRYDRLIETNSYKQAVNHFEFHQEISNKQYLIQNLVQYCQQNQMRVFDSLTPLTFVIDFNDENCETNLNLLLKIYERGLPLNKKKNFNQKSIFEFKRKIRHMFKNSNNDKIQSSYKKFKFKDVYLSDKEKSAYLWLLKPTFLNRGRGIHIFSELGELEKLLTDYFNGYEEKPFGVKEKEKKKIDFVKLNRNSQIIKLNSEYINPLKQNGHTGYQVQHKYNSNKNQISESKEEGQKENQGEKNQNQNENKNENSDQNKNNQNLQLNSPLQISQSTNVTNKEKVIKQGDETENNLDLQNQIIKNNSSIIQSKSQRESRQSLEIKNQNSEQNQNKIQNQYDIGINRQNNQINRRFLQSQQNTVFNDEEQILIQRMSLKSQKKQQPTYYSYQPNNNNNQEKKNFDGNRYIKNTFNGPTILRSYEFVIQKYIERPLLCKQKKFDIRVWVLVNHEMECYFFKEGYIRLSSEKYSNEDDQKENIFIHLTNNAIQVNCENYGKEDEGNQMSFFNFEKQIQKEGNKNFDFQKQVYEQMVEKSMLCLKAAQKKLDPNSRKFCFEIFGYDYILDEDYNAWLIEVNTNPAIEECSALLKMLIPRMIDDAFKLSLDKIFPVKKGVQEVLQQKKQEQTKNQEFLEKKQNKVKDNEVVDQKNEVENLDKNIDQKDNKEIQVNQADTQSKENLEKFFSVKGYKDDENMWQYMGSIKN